MRWLTQSYETVLKFWFQEIDSAMWFAKDDAFDQEIKRRFEKTYLQAIKGELYPWRENLLGRLAEIIVLDQFPRNMYRNSAKAFQADSLALILSQEAITIPEFSQLTSSQQRFTLMPWMHSESLGIHKQAEKLFEQYHLDKALKYERQHKEIIERFGRYPHRNIVLKRQSTPEEKEFLRDFQGF